MYIFNIVKFIFIILFTIIFLYSIIREIVKPNEQVILSTLIGIVSVIPLSTSVDSITCSFGFTISLIIIKVLWRY